MVLWTRYTAAAVVVELSFSGCVWRGWPFEHRNFRPRAGAVFMPSRQGCSQSGCTNTGTTIDFPSEAKVSLTVSQKAYSIQVGDFLADSDACQYHAGLSGQ